MSVQRWQVTDWHNEPALANERDEGTWVLYEDHAAEVARLTAERESALNDFVTMTKAAQEVSAEVIALREEIARLRGALEFYSQEDRYHGPNQPRLEGDRFTPEDNPYRTDVLRDGGRIARTALAPAARKEDERG